VSFFIKVFHETGCVAVVSEGFLLLLVVKKISFRHYIRCVDGRRGFIKMENYTAVLNLWYSVKYLEFKRLTL